MIRGRPKTFEYNKPKDARKKPGGKRKKQIMRWAIRTTVIFGNN